MCKRRNDYTSDRTRLEFYSTRGGEAASRREYRGWTATRNFNRLRIVFVQANSRREKLSFRDSFFFESKAKERKEKIESLEILKWEGMKKEYRNILSLIRSVIVSFAASTWTTLRLVPNFDQNWIPSGGSAKIVIVRFEWWRSFPSSCKQRRAVHRVLQFQTTADSNRGLERWRSKGFWNWVEIHPSQFPSRLLINRWLYSTISWYWHTLVSLSFSLSGWIESNGFKVLGVDRVEWKSSAFRSRDDTLHPLWLERTRERERGMV